MKRQTNRFVAYLKKVCAPHVYLFYTGALIVSALFLIVSLLSHNAHDSTWVQHQSNASTYHNMAGFWGAQCAALCFYLCGYVAFLVPLILLFFAWLVYHRRWNWQSADRISATALLILAGMGFCHRFKIGSAASCCGGHGGYSVHHLLLRLCDPTIATLFLCTALICACIILFPKAAWYLFSLIKRASIFLYRNPAIFISIAQSVLSFFWLMMRPFVLFVQRLHALYNGTWLPTSVSIVLFEQNKQTEKQNESSSLEPFWQEFLQERVNADAPKMSSHSSLPPSTQFHHKDLESKNISQPSRALNEPRTFKLPHGDLLIESGPKMHEDKMSTPELEKNAHILEEKLRHFGISGTVTAIKQGPVVTVFEYKPDIDARISKIIALEDDLALALQALSIRIIAPIPGKSVIGIEVPNKNRLPVSLFKIMQHEHFKHSAAALKIALGVDTVGNNVIVDLAHMPHLLVAGSTGSGKSVALHTMLISLLCTHTPETLRLILIDPKRLEFAPYADIAHLIFPIINTPAQALPALSWVVQEMETRYERMTVAGVRTIAEFNEYAIKNNDDPLAYIVVCIDELADLMMLAGKESEDLITRIAQMARAAGIHMIVATQRPSVDVITGLIKVNFPSRISFRISTKIDSRTIIDCCGAEKLLGNGDMLLLDSHDTFIKRVQGAFIARNDIERIIQFIKNQQAPQYESLQNACAYQSSLESADEELFKAVLAFIQGMDEISISLIQRKFRIGYNRSARIIDTLADRGFISKADGQKMRKVIHH